MRRGRLGCRMGTIHSRKQKEELEHMKETGQQEMKRLQETVPQETKRLQEARLQEGNLHQEVNTDGQA